MPHAVLIHNKSCVLIEYSSGFLRVKTLNYEIEARPRTVTIKGCFNVKVSTINRGRKKAVYISHERLQLFHEEQCRNAPVDELNTGEFIVRATSTPHGDYITIMTPGAFLADYIIVSEDSTYIQLPGGREAYSEKEGGYCTIYIV